MSEAALARAAIDDDDALARLVGVYHDRVWRFGRSVCRNGTDTDDAVQEAFLQLSARKDVVEGPSPLAWLLQVVKHQCIRLLRPFTRSRRALHVDEDAAADVATDTPTPAEALLRFEIVRQVQAAIAALDVDARAVVVLRDLEGLPGKDVARVLGIGEEAMKSRLARARQAVRHHIERQAAGDP